MNLTGSTKLGTIAFLLFILSTAILLTACEEEDARTVSSQRDREIHIDGKDLEWQGVPQFYAENSRTVISFLHDEHYLFMRLASNDRHIQRQILVQGLTVWFEQPVERNRKTGVHFPVGLPREKRISMLERPPEEGRGTDKHLKSSDDGLLEKYLAEIQIWGPREYEQKTILLDKIRKYDVAVSIGKTDRNLIYELKVPFVQNNLTHFGLVNPGKKPIRVGFQTGDGEKTKERKMGHSTPDGQDSSEGRMGRGKRGGMGGGMGGGRSEDAGDRAGRKPIGESIEPLALWVTLSLTNASHQE